MRVIAGIAVGLALLAGAITIERVSAATPSEVTALIYEAAAYYGVDGDYLYAVALCETGGTLRSDLVGRYGERGVYQWHARGQWWVTPMGRAGYPIPAGNLHGDVFMAAWSFANGYGGAWSCA